MVGGAAIAEENEHAQTTGRKNGMVKDKEEGLIEAADEDMDEDGDVHRGNDDDDDDEEGEEEGENYDEDDDEIKYE